MAPPATVATESSNTSSPATSTPPQAIVCNSETKLEEWPYPKLPPLTIDYVELRYPQIAIFHNVRNQPIVRYTWRSTAGPARGAVVLLHDQGTHTVFEWLRHLPPLSKEERRQMEEDPEASEFEKKEFLRLRNASHYDGSWVEKFNEASLDVHAIDLQGHGLSKVVEGKHYQLPPSFDEFAEDVCWLLEEVCRHSTLPIFLIGQGLGATIATRATELLARQGKLGKPHVSRSTSSDAQDAGENSATPETSAKDRDDAPGLQYATDPQYCRHKGKGKKDVPTQHITVQARPIPIAGLVLLSPLLTLKELSPEEMHKNKGAQDEGIMSKIARCFGSSGHGPGPLAGVLGCRMHQKNPLMPDYNVWYQRDTMTLKGLTSYTLYQQIQQGIDSTVRDARWLLTPVERDSAHTFSLKDWQEKHRKWMEMMRAQQSNLLAALVARKRQGEPEVPDLAPWLKDEDADKKPWRLQPQAAAAQGDEESIGDEPDKKCQRERAKLAFYLNVLLVQSLEDSTALPRGTAYFFKRIGGRIQASREVLSRLGELPEESNRLGACFSCGQQDLRLGSGGEIADLTALDGDDEGWVEVVSDRSFREATAARSFQVPSSKGASTTSLSQVSGRSPAGTPGAQPQPAQTDTETRSATVCGKESTQQQEEPKPQVSTEGTETDSGAPATLLKREDAKSEAETHAVVEAKPPAGDDEGVQERVQKLVEANKRLDQDLQLTTKENFEDDLVRFGTTVRPAYMVRADSLADQEEKGDFVSVEEVKWVKEVPARGTGLLACCGVSSTRVKRVDVVEAKVRLVDKIVMMEATDAVKAMIDEIEERECAEKEKARQKTEQRNWLLNCIAGGEPIEKPATEPILYTQKKRWRRAQGVIVDEDGQKVPVEEVERLRKQKPEDYMRLFFRYGAATSGDNNARTALWLVQDMYHSLCQEDKKCHLVSKLLDQWILPILQDLEESEVIWREAAHAETPGDQ
ncbi:hypothetical protein BESB_067500 [Besnoitia besnoiti]|uniref:Serine aminopeptidase S33 domain-containing protein n=1 Tax=Besnoitia besnoiti TaxID=94643 RepID=A0A2A9MGK1_BESBE|nr:hypothetical protein BESB_067500 [Besnoitia besnoiti]PFH34717.1 hypothetical protein BESB_067500 [Besnoitia besnoiti]